MIPRDAATAGFDFYNALRFIISAALLVLGYFGRMFSASPTPSKAGGTSHGTRAIIMPICTPPYIMGVFPNLCS